MRRVFSLLALTAFAGTGCDFEGSPAEPDAGADAGIDAAVNDCESPVVGDWADEAFGARRLVTVAVVGDLNGFPVYVALSSELAPSVTDGTGLLFTDLSGNPVPHEIDHWDDSGGAAWVRTDIVGGAALLHVYYDHDGAMAPPEPDPAATFEGYEAVYHFSDAYGPAVTRDSIGGHDLTPTAALNSVDDAIDSPLGVGVALDALDSERFELLGTLLPQFQVPDSSTRVFELWFRGGPQGTPRGLFDTRVGHCGITISIDDSNFLRGRFSADPGCDGDLTGFTDTQSPATVTDNEWHHAALRIDRANQALALFLDGDNVNQILTAIPVAGNTGGGEVRIGSVFTEQLHHNGSLDEVRVSADRDPNWIRSTHRVVANDGAVMLSDEECR